MNNKNLIKIVFAVAILGIVALFATGTIKFSSPDTRSDNTDTATSPNNSPVPQVPQGTSLKVGEVFPSFTLTEIDGQTKTLASLKGRPAIIWFTTSWCVPCQVGALDVSKLDDELGGKVFNVLVVFVDPKEAATDLRLWRKRFAREDWMVAFDNELTQLAAKVNLRFLDSKFLLDKNGIIKNIDFAVADDKYLDTIRGVVEEN